MEGLDSMYKLFCFIKRDFLIQISYRFRLVLSFVGSLAAVFMFFFLGKTFQSGFSVYLARYGNDYFSFVLVGMSVTTFVSTGLYSLATEVRTAQIEGTLEYLLATPASPNMILFGNSAWSFVKSFMQSIVYLTVTVLIIKIDISLYQMALVLLVLLLTFLCFISLGMISAAFIMVFKQGNPINLVFGTLSYYLGGVIFPIEVLPVSLQKLSILLPMFHASKAIREILLVPEGKGEWIATILYLATFSFFAFPSGICMLRIALSRAKKEGSLVQF
jgi:ABC-2 type transport system permease protein